MSTKVLSGESMEGPMNFTDGIRLPRTLHHTPAPSRVSVKSAESMEGPINFKDGDFIRPHRNDPAIKEFQKKFKSNLKKKFQCVNGVIINLGTQTLLNEIYTELYITEGDSGDVNKEHEVRQIEAASRRTTTEETPIQCNDIFKPLSEQDKPIRTVLTKGVAGIGKTVSVQKFILDWAEGKTNQDVHLIFPLPFRELNLMKDQKLSLMELLHNYFCNETKKIKMSSLEKVLFIFDGLDECRFPLDFENTVRVCDVTEPVSVPVLLVNLIKGNLLPSALIWITSRPAAADQIPSECVHRVTEVRGFNDPQKEEYFRKRISDQSLANNIITHLKSLRSLYIMCHIPVFCWISAAVLERMLCEAESGEIPKTLTQMYTHFLIIQINIIREKYLKKQESDEEMLLKLGKLAFEQLKKGNLIFYEEDLRECGIDVREAAVYSGVCTQMFKEEFGLHKSKVYCFVHLSIQEHLAALYVHLMFMMEKKNVLDQGQDDESDHLLSNFPMSLGPRAHHRRLWARGRVHPEQGANLSQGTHTYTLIECDDMENVSDQGQDDESDDMENYSDQWQDDESDDMENYSDQWQDDESDDMEISDVHVHAIHQALESQTGHLDLFLRFLLGLSLKRNQKLLQVLVTQTGRSSQSTKETVQYIKMIICQEDKHTAEKSVNLIHCLIELGDNSLVEEIQHYLKSGKRGELSSSQWSALVFVLLTSAEELEEFDLNKYISEDKITEAVLLKVMPVIAASRKSIISWGSVGVNGVSALVSLFSSESSGLREVHLTLETLDLSWNKVEDSVVKDLSVVLANPHFKVENLRMIDCGVSDEGCVALTSALRSNPSHLRDLDLSYNHVGDSGVKCLSALLENPLCKLETLRLHSCDVSDEGCAALTSALRSNPSHLRKLNLSCNHVGDSGVKCLCAVLENPLCKLETLRLEHCGVSDEGCAALTSALRSNPSHLRDLDLSCNHVGDSGVKCLSALLENPLCKLETLRMIGCGVSDEGCAALTSALRSNPSHLRDLDLSWNNVGASGVKRLSALKDDEHYKLQTLT
ncbi:NLR family CARD domain-containing protein 3-like [Clarias gariepinus]